MSPQDRRFITGVIVTNLIASVFFGWELAREELRQQCYTERRVAC